MPTEPFAELKRQFEQWLGREDCPVHWTESANMNARYGFDAGWQAASPTPEMYAQAARQIAEENHRRWVQARMSMGIAETMQILTSILGQPGGKR
jgi:hypothetical protein